MITSSLNTFLGQPGLDGVSVGLGYFGVPDATGFGDSCNAADYAVPDVERLAGAIEVAANELVSAAAEAAGVP